MASQSRPPRQQSQPTLDEGQWPLYLAITAFAAYFAAASYYLLTWEHDKWYLDARAYLIATGLVWFMLMSLVPVLDQRVIRRGIQLSVVLSLILHLSFFIGMLTLDVLPSAELSMRPNRREPPRREPVVIPDYSPQQMEANEETTSEFEQPIDTDPVEVETQPVQQREQPVEQPQMTPLEVREMELQRRVDPNTPTKVQQEFQVPKETLQDLPSQLSRREQSIERPEPTPVERPEVTPQEDPTPPELAAAEAAMRRQATEIESRQVTPDVQSTASRAAELQRQQTEQATPTLEAQAANPLQRQATPRADQPRATEVANAPRAAEVQQAQVTPQASPQASANLTARRQAEATLSPAAAASASVENPTPRAAAASMARARSSDSGPISPQLARAEVPRMDRGSPSAPATSQRAEAGGARVNQQQFQQQQAAQAASGSLARSARSGDGVEMNSIPAGELLAGAAGGDTARDLVGGHSATRAEGTAGSGDLAGEVSFGALDRAQPSGAGGPQTSGVVVEYMGPGVAGADQAAERLAQGQIGAGQSGVGRMSEGSGSDLEGGPSGPAVGQIVATGGVRASDWKPSGGPITGRDSGSVGGDQVAGPSGSIPAARRGTSGGPGVVGAQADASQMASSNANGQGSAPSPGDLAGPAGGTSLGRSTAIGRQSGGGGMRVDVSAELGPGGLGNRPAAEVGVIGRRDLEESPQLALNATRFPVRSSPRSVPLLSTSAAVPTDAFSRRANRRTRAGEDSNQKPTKKTEEAIERGLLFLARHQMSDGSWSLRQFGTARPEFAEEYRNERSTLDSDTAATGLALLAFLGAGYNHLDEKYQQEVNKGLRFLIEHQTPGGDLFIPMDRQSNSAGRLYSHGIAALALCEAYGMTQDEQLREPAQKAIDYITAAQDPRLGGWRYIPGDGSDTSVTGWMLLALKSGQLAGLSVEPEVFEGIKKWLDAASYESQGRSLYVYNPQAENTPQQGHGRLPSRTMTSVGALIQLYLGNRRDSKVLRDSADYMLEHLPQEGTPGNPQRDTYYWYYATQVMFHMKGEYWEKWDSKLHTILEDSQVLSGTMEGSWEPLGDIPDRWGPHAGRIYVTAMNLLSLEVYHRHLPLYDDVAK